jgi:nucleotide-binding universal stress UspA family protein
MEPHQLGRAVVVGVDGSHSAQQAARWAAAEAERRKAPLRLVTAHPWDPPPAGARGGYSAAFDEVLRADGPRWASVFGPGFLTGPRHRRAHPPQRTGLRPDLPGRRSAARAAAEPPCESPEAP